MTRGASAPGVKQGGHLDGPGGGQGAVDGQAAYVARMRAPHGTTLVAVRGLHPLERV